MPPADPAELQPAEAGRGARLSWLLVLLAAGLLLPAAVADRADRVRHLELTCEARECRAAIDGATPLVLPRGERPAGGKIGLYAFAPWEVETSQAFRNLVLRTNGGLVTEASLLGHDEIPDGLLRDGWSVESGRGLLPEATAGTRSVTSLDGVRAENFTLELDLIQPVDAGVLFHAAGVADGTVLVVRPGRNDLYFFELDNGRPGAALELGALSELRVDRELYRLGGLLGRILLVSVIGLALLRRFGRAIDPAPFSLASCARWLDRPRPPRWLLPALFVLSVTLGGLVAILGLGAVPHIPDETAYLFQAKIFAAGELWAPSPPAAEFFLHEHIVHDDGRWFGKYPPLYPLLLAVGVRTGLPWLINPLIGALTALVVYGLASTLANWRWGIVAWLLTLSSPFFLIMNGTHMSHPTSALCVTLFVWLSLVAFRRHRLATAFGAGVVLGLALLTRPYTAFLAAIVVASYGLYLWLRTPVVMRALISIAAGTSLFVAAFFFWSGRQLQEANYSHDAYAAYDSSDRLGFGADKGAGWLKTWGSWGHTPAKALRSVHQFLDYSASHLLGWPLWLSFALVVAHLLWGRSTPGAWLPLLLFGALVVGHMFYWATQHIAYGARYWFAAAPGLMVVSALGLRALARDRGGALCAALAMVVLVGANLGGYLPDRLRELPSYGGVTAKLAREVERRELDGALVFVRTEGLLYNDGFFLNDPFFERGSVFARDLGRHNETLTAIYPEREAFVWNGERLTSFGPRSRGR